MLAIHILSNTYTFFLKLLSGANDRELTLRLIDHQPFMQHPLSDVPDATFHYSYGRNIISSARQEQQCDKQETTPAVITSENHPSSYQRNSDCRYCVKSKAQGESILEKYRNCFSWKYFDYIFIQPKNHYILFYHPEWCPLSFVWTAEFTRADNPRFDQKIYNYIQGIMYLLKLTLWNSIQEETVTQAKTILSLKILTVHQFQVQSVLL